MIMETTKLGMNYITALRKKYEAEMAEAKANLALYVNNLVAIGEHSDLMEEHDKWVEKYTNSKDKLETLNELFASQEEIIKG
jgi:hypothetical protein